MLGIERCGVTLEPGGDCLTDGDGLNLDALLNVGVCRVIRVLMGEDALAAKGVDEGRSAYD